MNTATVHTQSPHHESRPLLRRTETNLRNEEEVIDYLYDDSADWRRVARQIQAQNELTQRERNSILGKLAQDYITVFGPKASGKTYLQLKDEVKFLAELTRRSLIHMAIRLLIIHDRQLYKQDGYDDFKSFVDEELPISRSTVYNYMDIARHFGIQPVAQLEEFEYSKLLPVLPLLKSENHRIPKDRIKRHFLELACYMSRRDIENEARELKRCYGLDRPRHVKAENLLHFVRKNLPSAPSDQEKQILEEIVALIRLSLTTKA